MSEWKEKENRAYSQGKEVLDLLTPKLRELSWQHFNEMNKHVPPDTRYETTIRLMVDNAFGTHHVWVCTRCVNKENWPIDTQLYLEHSLADAKAERPTAEELKAHMRQTLDGSCFPKMELDDNASD